MLETLAVRSFVNKLAEIKTWLSNGQGYIADVKYPIIFAIGLKVYLPEANSVQLVCIALLGVGFLILIGWIDLRFIRLHQKIQEIQTEKYNPYFSRLRKNLNTRRTSRN